VITRQTKIKLLAFATLAVLGMSYLGFKYVGLDRVILGSGYDVAADFKDSGGIFVNAEVTYRGTAVGRVSDMQLTHDGVRVTLTIKPDTDPIPSDTDAVVATRSAVGEQYVDLRPKGDKGPYLGDGDVIPQSRTSIPVPVEQLMLNLDNLVNSLDKDHLKVVVDELGKAFNGAGDDLGRLVDSGDLLLARAEQSLPQTLKLITDGETVLQTQVDSRSAIKQWASDLRTFTDTLVDIDPDLRSLVVNAPDASAAIQQLVDNAGPGLGSLVRNLDILNKVTIPRLDGVEQMLVTYPDVVSGNFTVVRRDADGQMRSHFGFVVNAGDPNPCTTGYIPTSRLPSPGAVKNAPIDQAHCAVINGVDPSPGDGYDETGSDIRGAQNIGGSGGNASKGPSSASGSLPNPSAAVAGDVLGQLLHANPFASTVG
jgi:phospholipid/cholesterol/gamma-HCH transport system substrate-binding protein